METIIKYEAPSYAEQETIILYDKLTHNYRVGRNSKGKTTFLDGWLDVKNYSINVRKRQHFTPEQRKEMATRLLVARRKKGVDV